MGKASKRKKSGWAARAAEHPLLVLLGSVLGIVAALITVLQFVDSDGSPDANQEAGGVSRPSLLRVKASVDSEVTTYVLPLTTNMSSFPWETSANCTEAQRRWLSKYGTERQTEFYLDMRSAESGGKSMLAISNMRLEGTVTSKSDPVFIFDCPAGGTSEYLEVRQPIDTDKQARLTEDDRPFGFNLEPGELGQVKVSLDGGNGFEGALVADVAAGERTVKQTFIAGKMLHVPSAAGWSRLRVLVGLEPGMFSCFDTEIFDSTQCSGDQIASVAEAMRG